MTPVQELAAQLVRQLGIEVSGGQLQVVLNFNQNLFETWDVKVHGKAAQKPVDNQPVLRARLTR